MKALHGLLARLDALKERERFVICMAGAVVILTIAYFGAIDPLLVRRGQLRLQTAAHNELLARLGAQRLEVQRELSISPDEAIRQRLASAEAELASVDQALSGLERELLKPDRMAAVLQELLGKDRGVTLVSLKNLPPSLLDKQQASAAAGPHGSSTAAAGAPRIYRHGVEIVVEGGYTDLVAYLQRLEEQPWHLYWDKTVMTSNYPKSRLTLVLSTLSLDEMWLVV